LPLALCSAACACANRRTPLVTRLRAHMLERAPHAPCTRRRGMPRGPRCVHALRRGGRQKSPGAGGPFATSSPVSVWTRARGNARAAQRGSGQVQSVRRITMLEEDEEAALPLWPLLLRVNSCFLFFKVSAVHGSCLSSVGEGCV
jgi:hypothetical protein